MGLKEKEERKKEKKRKEKKEASRKIRFSEANEGSRDLAESAEQSPAVKRAWKKCFSDLCGTFLQLRHFRGTIFNTGSFRGH
jgi:hypothetical protein